MRSILFATLMLAVSMASAGNVKLSWTPSTTCEDGTAAATFCPTTGFTVEESTSATGTFAQKEIVAATLTTKTYSNVLPGDHCYRLRQNSAGGNSVPSNVGCVTVPFSPPKAPSVTVTVEITVAVNDRGEPEISVKTAQLGP